MDHPTPPHGLRPYLVIDGEDDPIAFYEEAFGAELVYALRMPDGRIGHAELRAFGERFALSHAFPEMNAQGPSARGGTTVSLGIYVQDVDAATERAVAAGAALERPIRDEFFGDRVAMLVDRFGHRWHLQTRQEDVSAEEMQRRLDAMMG
ncbi:MAG: VOC family protein [Myxococcota bacterium]